MRGDLTTYYIKRTLLQWLMLSRVLSKIRYLLCSRRIACSCEPTIHPIAEDVEISPLPFPLFIWELVQSPSWEANWSAASQEIPRISRNPKVYYRTHKLPPPVSIQSIYTHPTSWRSVLILSAYLRLGLASGLLPSGFPTKTLHTPLSSPIRATCPAHLILLDFITRTILGEEYKSFGSSLCNLLHSPVISSLLGPNILLNTLFSNTLRMHGHLHVKSIITQFELSCKGVNGCPMAGYIRKILKKKKSNPANQIINVHTSLIGFHYLFSLRLKKTPHFTRNLMHDVMALVLYAVRIWNYHLGLIVVINQLDAKNLVL